MFRSDGTLRQLLTKTKTRTSDLERKEVVYRIPCHIEETGRSLHKRLMEHKYAVKKGDI